MYSKAKYFFLKFNSIPFQSHTFDKIPTDQKSKPLCCLKRISNKVWNVVKTTTPTMLITFDWAPAAVVGIQKVRKLHTIFVKSKYKEFLFTHTNSFLQLLQCPSFTIRYGQNILIKTYQHKKEKHTHKIELSCNTNTYK